MPLLRGIGGYQAGFRMISNNLEEEKKESAPEESYIPERNLPIQFMIDYDDQNSANLAI